MLQDVNWAEDRSYDTQTEHEPIQFYLEALCNSTHLDLLLGYFSSAAINVLSAGFATFLSQGGTVRLIVNNILSEDDKAAITAGINHRVDHKLYDINDIKTLKSSLDDYGRHFFECLAWLISNNKIQIKIVRPKNKKGISHYKSGIFSDGSNQVCFKGSCNFTAYGLLENLEEIGIFLSWEDGRSIKEIQKQTNRFERIFSGETDSIEFIHPEEVIVAIKDEFGNKNIDELIIQEQHLLTLKSSQISNKRLIKIINTVEERITKYSKQPRFPYPQGPRPYQEQAYKNWIKNDRKGIFAMATGTGKTITSLNCLLQDYKQKGSYKAVILVPTISLLTQWKKECQKFNYRNIITVSTKEEWNESISFFNTANTLTNTSFIVILTYASLTRSKFKSHFYSFPKETVLIADEAHNIGSPSVQKFLSKCHLANRIGLSATPKRQYDDLGNQMIEDFFNDKPPFTFEYTMKEAMETKPPALCKYTYYPHVVFLADEELTEYIKISKRLLNYIDPKTGKYKDCPEVDNLLLSRKRIIHKAKNKKPVFRHILDSEFKKRRSLKYTLVYVPEGKEVDYIISDEYFENEEEDRLINEYTRAVSETDNSVLVRQYTGATKNREQIIRDFEKGNIHVLTSMKCLDEGVDVPRSELAIFCASTGNPRQFIQRRGRVLRLHDDKIHSVIHDLVVMPKINATESNYEMERNLIKKELERVVDFSELSMNKMDTYEELNELLDFYNLNLNDIKPND